MRLLHELAKIHASFDDPNLVSRAGLERLVEAVSFLVSYINVHQRPTTCTAGKRGERRATVQA